MNSDSYAAADTVPEDDKKKGVDGRSTDNAHETGGVILMGRIQQEEPSRLTPREHTSMDIRAIILRATSIAAQLSSFLSLSTDRVSVTAPSANRSTAACWLLCPVQVLLFLMCR